MTSLLAGAGFAIDFLLYPMDDDWQTAVPAALADMHRAWGSHDGLVAVVPPGRPLHLPPSGAHHCLDDWWDPAIDAHLAFLVARRTYTVMLVNYVFLSRAFLHAPTRCRRILDTHDRLSGRRELFERHGVAPEFFFTTPSEETKAFARADVVVAIKPSEAAAFRAITDREVLLVPFATSRPRSRSVERMPGAPLRVGFIGADNSVNAVNLAEFLNRVAVWCSVYLPHLEIVVAGNVCRKIAAQPGFVRVLGRVDDIKSFYDAVDLVVAPLRFSTGLKIKVAEALGHGKPIVATADAFDGFHATDPFHALPDIEAVCAALVALAADCKRLDVLARATRVAAAASHRAAAVGAAAFIAAVTKPDAVLHFVTDLDFAARSTLAEERCWQAMQFFSAAVEVRVTRPDVKELPGGSPVVATWIDCTTAPPQLGPPPLRHLPMRLETSGSAWGGLPRGKPFAIVAVERSDIAEEEAAREALVRALTDACAPIRVTVLYAKDLPRDAAFLAALAECSAPHSIVAIDLGEEARDLLASLAGFVEAAFFALGDPYPLLPEGAAPRPVRNLREHIAAVADWLRSPTPLRASAATSDAGWSVLWANLVQPRRASERSAAALPTAAWAAASG